jgi:hypothetical protein
MEAAMRAILTAAANEERPARGLPDAILARFAEAAASTSSSPRSNG